jgi:8-oxo-dGTP pyrophosphatase MutT (NUDIX family)
VTADIARRAARVLLVDGAGRVLLFRGFDPRRPNVRYWFTAGGGLDVGETHAQAAARELCEETGLRVPADTLGPPVYRNVERCPFDGVWYRQEQEFFVVRVESWQVSTSGFQAIELSSMDGHRWWSVDELERTGERFYPADLPTLLRTVVEA